jgi:hypothetical protein
MKRIKYFSYYGCNDAERRRDNSPAADSKIDYIVEVLNRCGYAVDIISKASSSNGKFVRGYVEKNDANTLRYFHSLGGNNKIFRLFNRYLLNIQFLIFCLFNIKSNEQIIVYHSLGYASAFLKLKRWKRIQIVGEIEEIYQDVHKQKSSWERDEYRFFDVCDKYMFPTKLLNEKLNPEGKPVVTIHGVYSLENNILPKYDDGLIHVVYGGTLDPQKGGAAAAAAAAAFLPSNYHVHICGFGDSTEIKNIIADVSEHAQATITFEGELKGDDYKHFIQKCHIGMSTQNPAATFNATSFPSKILVYMSNGLKVVSIRIPAIEQSVVADNIFFYNKQTPRAIAQAIVSASSKEMDCREVLLKADKDFENNFKILLEK